MKKALAHLASTSFFPIQHADRPDHERQIESPGNEGFVTGFRKIHFGNAPALDRRQQILSRPVERFLQDRR